MSKKEFYKDIYYSKYNLLFASIVHRKGSGPIKNEKERIQKIIKEISEFNKKDRFIIFKKYLNLFSSSIEDIEYHIIPKTTSVKQVQQVVEKFSNDKQATNHFEDDFEIQREENSEDIKKEKINIVEEVNHFPNNRVDNEKELLNPRADFPVKKDLNELELIKLPKINTNKIEIKKFGSDLHFKGNLNPQKKISSVILTERNRTIVNNLKEIYENKCQICSQRLETGYNKEYYSEVHHIQPLGKHKGPDVAENMIVVCPNHHTLFDKGAISIDISKKKILHFLEINHLNGKPLLLKHQLNQKYIDYHNEKIFLREEKKFDSPRKVNYGDTVVFSDGDHTEEITLENYVNRGLMNNMQRMLLNKLEGEPFTFNDFEYHVLKIN